MKTMKLYEKDENNATRFKNKHIVYTKLIRLFNNVKYTITFSETLLGSFVTLQCGKSF